jgi:hypothetical protein
LNKCGVQTGLSVGKIHILRETTGWKRDKQYVYDDYLNILAEGTKI